MGKSSKTAVTAAAPAVAAKANADAKASSKSKKEGKKVATAPVEAAPVKVSSTVPHLPVVVELTW